MNIVESCRRFLRAEDRVPEVLHPVFLLSEGVFRNLLQVSPCNQVLQGLRAACLSIV